MVKLQNLEKDIIIKERIIESSKNNKYNYQSISNYNNLYIENDNKFEKLLEYIINKEEEIENNKKSYLDNGTFLNGILDPFYYSMMINKNQNINDLLLNLLKNLITNIMEKEKK